MLERPRARRFLYRLLLLAGNVCALLHCRAFLGGEFARVAQRRIGIAPEREFLSLCADVVAQRPCGRALARKSEGQAVAIRLCDRSTRFNPIANLYVRQHSHNHLYDVGMGSYAISSYPLASSYPSSYP